jgi:hypothetical protein
MLKFKSKIIIKINSVSVFTHRYFSTKLKVYSKYIPRLKKEHSKIHKFITADFETIVYNNTHYVIVACIFYIDDLGNIVKLANSIEPEELEEDFSNIEILSNKVLILF